MRGAIRPSERSVGIPCRKVSLNHCAHLVKLLGRLVGKAANASQDALTWAKMAGFLAFRPLSRPKKRDRNEKSRTET